MAEKGELDDVPPLEDMSELMHQVSAIQEKQAPTVTKTIKSTSKVQHAGGNATAITTQKSPEKKVSEKSRVEPIVEKSSFGGFKKGFMFGSNTKPSKKPEANVSVKTASSDIPFIKPSEPKGTENPLRLPEVQNAMDASQAMLDNKDNWLTEDLLEKVSKSPALMQRLTDRKFVEAFAEFQTNPSEAMVKYKDNPEMQSFIKEFSGIVGEHFSCLGDESDMAVQTTEAQGGPVLGGDSSQPSAEDERKMQTILANPEIRDILQDPRIQKLLEVLRSDPDKAQRVLQSGDAEVKNMIGKLCEAGILQLQR